MRINDWSSDVCSSDLRSTAEVFAPDMPDPAYTLPELAQHGYTPAPGEPVVGSDEGATVFNFEGADGPEQWIGYRNFYVITRSNHSPMYAMAVHQLAQAIRAGDRAAGARNRSEEHTSELQSLMRLSYAVFCLTQTNNA